MAGSRSWHARFSVLTYLQIMVFYNLFTLLSVPAEVVCIRRLVMQLLLDEQLEVMYAEKSSKTLALIQPSPFSKVGESQDYKWPLIVPKSPLTKS